MTREANKHKGVPAVVRSHRVLSCYSATCMYVCAMHQRSITRHYKTECGAAHVMHQVVADCNVGMPHSCCESTDNELMKSN